MTSALSKKLFELELNRGEYQTILSNKITLEKLLRELQAQDPKAKDKEGTLRPSFCVSVSLRDGNPLLRRSDRA